MGQYRTSLEIREELNALHDSGLSWRKIAALPQYVDIPPGTLHTIANHPEKPIPVKHRKKLGMMKVEKPAWLLEAVEKLAALEAAAQPSPGRTYNRRGQRVT